MIGTEPVELRKLAWLIVRREGHVPTHVRSALDGQPIPVRIELNRWRRSSFITRQGRAVPCTPLAWRLR